MPAQSLPADRLKRKLRPITIRTRNHLRDHGWTFETAARAVNRSTSHVTKVLTGEHHSETLCEHLLALPPRESVTL